MLEYIDFKRIFRFKRLFIDPFKNLFKRYLKELFNINQWEPLMGTKKEPAK